MQHGPKKRGSSIPRFQRIKCVCLIFRRSPKRTTSRSKRVMSSLCRFGEGAGETDGHSRAAAFLPPPRQPVRLARLPSCSGSLGLPLHHDYYMPASKRTMNRSQMLQDSIAGVTTQKSISDCKISAGVFARPTAARSRVYLETSTTATATTQSSQTQKLRQHAPLYSSRSVNASVLPLEQVQLVEVAGLAVLDGFADVVNGVLYCFHVVCCVLCCLCGF